MIRMISHITKRQPGHSDSFPYVKFIPDIPLFVQFQKVLDRVIGVFGTQPPSGRDANRTEGSWCHPFLGIGR